MTASPADRRPHPGPDVARAAWGALCLLAPASVQRVLSGGRVDARGVLVLRVLGGRHLVQAAATRLLPPRPALGGGAAADGLHALSALALAAVDARRRRAALVEAALATAWCAWWVRRCRRS